MYIYIHVVGGSSYIGGCNAAYPITYESGVTGTTNTETLPGGSTRSDYIPGVGVGKVGAHATLQSPGGNGAIVLTFIPTTATPSLQLSLPLIHHRHLPLLCLSIFLQSCLLQVSQSLINQPHLLLLRLFLFLLFLHLS